MVGFEMVESPQRVLSPGLAGQDESVRDRTAAIGVISPDRIGSANIIGRFTDTVAADSFARDAIVPACRYSPPA